MSEECTHDCNSCGQNCGSRSPESLVATPYKGTKIGKIIGVVSGKGGVGKSMVTDLLAVSLAKKGYKVGILDADITGPSIPAAFGLTEKATSNDEVMFPVYSKELHIPVMSINLLLENESDPVIWRGPIIAGTVKQFYTEVAWGELDYLLVDMPPGTGDVPLTVFQSITVDGIIVVTSPQQLVSMIVEKAVKMAQENGYSEPDPRIDLSGKDVIRKLVILARESGYRVDIDDIERNLFIPQELFDGSLENFWEHLPELDAQFEAERQRLAAEGKRWRFVAEWADGRGSVGLKEINQGHPLYDLEGSNNILMLTTERYNAYPMLIQGYGAGAAVTAAGVFADIMRVANV